MHRNQGNLENYKYKGFKTFLENIFKKVWKKSG